MINLKKKARLIMMKKNKNKKFNLDEVETAIDEIEVDSPVLDNRVYNLNGAVVGNTTSNLKKGIYIVNGKKVVKK